MSSGLQPSRTGQHRALERQNPPDPVLALACPLCPLQHPRPGTSGRADRASQRTTPDRRLHPGRQPALHGGRNHGRLNKSWTLRVLHEPDNFSRSKQPDHQCPGRCCGPRLTDIDQEGLLCSIYIERSSSRYGETLSEVSMSEKCHRGGLGV